MQIDNLPKCNLIAGKSKKTRKEILENQQNADVQRDRYYATIHKVPGLVGDKIPGSPFTLLFLIVIIFYLLC